MGLFGKLFDKKECAICGGAVGGWSAQHVTDLRKRREFLASTDHQLSMSSLHRPAAI